MIELKGITKIYNQGRPNEVTAVRGVSLDIPGDRLVVLKGPSGSGKTTLLTMIGCLARPSEGRVLLDGEIISALPDNFMTRVRRKTFGFVFQRFNLIRGMSVLENVTIPAYPEGLPWRELRARGMELLERFHLGHKAAEKSEFLSGGESQRVAIARALINDPRWIIADEPTANLDSRLALRFMEEMERLRAAGKSIIISSHDERVFNAGIVDMVVEMEDGGIVSVERRR